MFISEAFAQTAAPAAQGGAGSTLVGLLPLIGMLVVLYLLMVRPQLKRQKEHRALVDALGVGDEVVMASGILGRVSRLRDGGLLDVQIASGVEVLVQRDAVAQVLPKGTIR